MHGHMMVKKAYTNDEKVYYHNQKTTSLDA
jgi:hypothetical protein